MKFGNYTINNPESFETPEYVIFENILQHNIDTILSMVKTPSRLIPHAKTQQNQSSQNSLPTKPTLQKMQLDVLTLEVTVWL